MEDTTNSSTQVVQLIRKEDKPEGPKLKVRKKDYFILSRNLKAMVPEMTEVITKEEDLPRIKAKYPNLKPLLDAPNTETLIDSNICIRNCNNPLMMVYIGFSTRGLYDSIKRNKKVTRTSIMIEPNLSVFKELLFTEDITDLILDPKIELMMGVNPEDLVNTMIQIFNKFDEGQPYSRVTQILNMEKLRDPFTVKNNNDLFSLIDTKVDEAVQQVQLSLGCSDDQFRRWELMYINANEMFNAYNITLLFNKFKDFPCFVLGGGPSLIDFINYAKANPEEIKKSIIIAADAVLPVLGKEGIKPNFVPRCERKLTGIFKDVTPDMVKDVNYVAYPWTPPEFFKIFESTFYAFRSNGACIYTGLPHGRVNGGVSSANAALELALLLGCKTIILSGVDCVKDDSGKTHVAGTQVEFNMEASEKKKSFQLLCNDGKTRTAIAVWNRCLNEYIQSIVKHTEKRKERITIYNTALTGAKIAYTDYIAIDRLPKTIYNIPFIAKEIIDNNKQKLTEEQINKFKALNTDTLKMLLDLKESITVVKNLVEDAERTKDREIAKMIQFVYSDLKGYDVVKAVRQQKGNLEKLWNNIVDMYDFHFKSKWLPNQLFRTIFLDVLQLDTFMYENMVASITNTLEFRDEQYEAYCKATKGWIDRISYYTDEFIRVLKENK